MRLLVGGSLLCLLLVVCSTLVHGLARRRPTNDGDSSFERFSSHGLDSSSSGEEDVRVEQTFEEKRRQLDGDSNDKWGRDTYYTYKSVCIVDGKPKLLDFFECRNQVAVGRFQNAINSTGWSYLEIETFAGHEPDLQAYAAGVLEGTLSRHVIEYTLQNTYYTYCNGYKNFCKTLGSYLKKNFEYIKQKVDTAPRDDLYWQTVRRAFYQLTGVWDGFRGADFSPSILYEVHPIFLININGELYDLEKKFNKTKDPMVINEKCSGLVKVAPNNADIFFSQVTMSGFQNLLRVLKLYKFGGYEKHQYAGHTNTFSSYPGMLYSSDDFALSSSGLAILETTISTWNNDVFEKVTPEGQLHTWVRAITANLLARSGREWCKIFSRHNSGTYNNQWVILDYKRFTPYKELPDYGLLYVLEQMPGKIVFGDETQHLKKETYYASYNIPFYKQISELSGFEKKAKEFYWFSLENCPRANIFRRDHTKVVDLDSLTSLMRYNDYKNEEYSRCNCTPPYTAEAAISARGDLNDPNGIYPLKGMGFVNHGALDYKGTNYELFKQLRFRAIGSPSYEHVPPFQWSKSNLEKTVKHAGHPDLWNFEAVEKKWETFDVRADL